MNSLGGKQNSSWLKNGVYSGRMLLCVRDRAVSESPVHASLHQQFSHGHSTSHDKGSLNAAGVGTRFSHFLPTSRRIVQFSNQKVAGYQLFPFLHCKSHWHEEDTCIENMVWLWVSWGQVEHILNELAGSRGQDQKHVLCTWMEPLTCSMLAMWRYRIACFEKLYCDQRTCWQILVTRLYWNVCFCIWLVPWPFLTKMLTFWNQISCHLNWSRNGSANLDVSMSHMFTANRLWRKFLTQTASFHLLKQCNVVCYIAQHISSNCQWC